MSELAVNEKIKENYLKQNRSVNIKELFEKQDQLKSSGLEGIEVRNTPKSLGKDDFLKLLITQLSHQDPTQPVQDQQFIAQMAQFSSLEQMQNVASHVKAMTDKQSLSLVGKFVSGFDELTGQDIAGVAAALFYDESGDAFLKVGEGAIAVSKVKIVGEPAFFMPPVERRSQIQSAVQEDPSIKSSGKDSVQKEPAAVEMNPADSRLKETNAEQLKQSESKENETKQPSGEVREDEIKKDQINKEKVSFFEFTREKEESYFSF